MAIEIKELIVRLTVNNSGASPQKTQKAGNSFTTADKKEIIRECVEQVMEKLELKNIR
jgi:hypothetical protein